MNDSKMNELVQGHKHDIELDHEQKRIDLKNEEGNNMKKLDEKGDLILEKFKKFEDSNKKVEKVTNEISDFNNLNILDNEHILATNCSMLKPTGLISSIFS